MAKKIKQYSEAELIRLFDLQRLVGNQSHPLLAEWLNCTTVLNPNEQYLFDIILNDAKEKIEGWQEEDLKMQFIAFVLRIADLSSNEKHYQPYFERTVSAMVGEHFLKVKTDFMIAKGILNMPEVPYFHFQEWKKHRDPSGDPVAQLLEALLCAQEINKNGKPLYGCTISGKYWEFFVLIEKTYAISKSYDCTEQDDLLQIIAILRKFKEILETQLLD
jgi:hypothetical protein